VYTINDMSVDQEHSAFLALEGERYISLATLRRNGTTVATPVWFVMVEGNVCLYTGANTGKVKRVRANPRVTVTPCTLRGDVTGPTIIGTARLVSDPAEIKCIIAALGAKYSWQYRLLMWYSALTSRLQRGASAQWAYIAISSQT
jgi:PPOX class probable F420-dependent enzyme